MQRWMPAMMVAALCPAMTGPVWGAPSPQVTPYARQEALAIRQVQPASATVPQFDRLELVVGLGATYDNPFDPDDVALDARVTTPAGRQYHRAGFFHQAYAREPDGRGERLTKVGPPTWRVRLAFAEVGEHRVVLTLRDRTGAVDSPPVRVGVSAAERRGFVRISPRDRRYFEFDNGEPMFPIGANTCWAYGRGTYDYDEWFARYAAVGANFGRLWLAPHWTTFALDRPGPVGEGLGLGQFDLANAWRIDYVLDLAARHGLWLKVCIESFNILRQNAQYGQWENTPHNAAHGGPLQRPAEFWTDATMDRLFRNKLRYLVARYGASTHLFAWEFWNEADITTDYRTAPARDWHQRMARALREADPYDHLITTSFAHTPGDPEIDRLPEMDFAQSHHYGSADIVQTVAQTQRRKAAYGKPHYFGEIGADAGGPRGKDDPQGLQVHDPLWVSVATGGSGAAQSWWWDNLIHPLDLYPLFAPLVQFTAGIDWPAERFQTVEPVLDWVAPPEPGARRDLILEDGPVSWERSDFNRPRTVRVTRSGATGDLPLAGIQHGLGGHRDKHNPVTFELDLPWPVRLEVIVGDVSGWGGATLQVTVDGKPVLQREFPDADDTHETLREFAGTNAVEVPAGRHVVVVENTGRDWFRVDYRLPGAVEQVRPPVLAWGLAGERTALAWARLEERSWQNVCARKLPIAAAPATVLRLPGLAAGEWQVEVWDTWDGDIVSRASAVVGASGEARVRLPAMARDWAVKLRQ